MVESNNLKSALYNITKEKNIMPQFTFALTEEEAVHLNASAAGANKSVPAYIRAQLGYQSKEKVALVFEKDISERVGAYPQGIMFTTRNLFTFDEWQGFPAAKRMGFSKCLKDSAEKLGLVVRIDERQAWFEKPKA